MAGKASRLKILITAGGTREYIDPVRFISNASSGRMGYALARAALRAGHKVTLITAPTALKPPAGARLIPAVTSDQMFTAVRTEFARCDCLIMAAAVADYKPLIRQKAKLKKAGGILTLRLKPTADILAWAGRHKARGQILVGFALEDRNLRKNAEGKLKAKNLDLIVANSPAAIGREQAAVCLKPARGPWTALPQTRKAVISKRIIRLINDLFLLTGTPGKNRRNEKR